MNAQEFMKEFTSWATTRRDILAVALVGSYARGTATVKSDVDLAIIATEPGILLSERSWTKEFGVVSREQIEDYGKVTSVRIWYQNGLEVEYGVTDRSWAELPLDAGTAEVMRGGFKVLFDPHGLLARASVPQP
jgi:predicted nucleotidyltransferase